jgi:capsular polysaccharide biosynthesis protein
MMKKLVMGIVLGIFLVGMVLTIRFIMNDKIQTEEDIEDYLETSVLAVIPVDKELAYYSKQEEKTEKERHRSHKKRKKS